MVVKTFYHVVELAFSWFPLNVFHAKVSLFVPHACTYLSSIQRTYEVKTCVQRPSSYMEAMVPWFYFDLNGRSPTMFRVQWIWSARCP